MTQQFQAPILSSRPPPADAPQLALDSDRPAQILRFLRDGMRGGTPGALVTLTQITGGAARPLGAHMAVLRDGHYSGMVSGGCVEAAVAREALAALHQGRDRICRFGQGSPFFDIVLPCGGGIALAIHVLRDLAPLDALLATLEARRPGALDYDPAEQRLLFSTKGRRTGWREARFQTCYLPEPVILLSGQGLEARQFHAIATAAGLRVVALEPGTAIAGDDSEQAFVLLQHDLHRELPALRRALASPAFFIGCLGSRRTHEERLRLLRAEGYDADQLARIQAPIGLFGPSREARTVAVSALAQVLSVLEARRP